MRLRVTLISILLAGSVQAMEPGTYRPGQPYHSSKAGSAYACSAQCQSDNQCKSWNFVTVNREAKYGVCEYNARRVAPVSSPVSVSGDSIAANKTSTQIVSAGTRTLRVGSMPAARNAYPGASGPTPSRVRASQPVTGKAMPQHAGYTSPPLQRPVHALDTLPQPSRLQTAMPQAQPAVPRAPQFKHSLEALPAMRPQPTIQAKPQSATMLSTARPAYPVAHQTPQAAPRQMPIPKAGSKVVSRQAPPVAKPATVSLYGSLHDDVQVPNPSIAVPLDKDAPISTVSSVPTQKIMQDRLYGMAGPQR